MRTYQVTHTSGAAVEAGFALSTAPTTGATWTLTNTATTDGLAHLVTIHLQEATNHSLKTATIVGTDADGTPQTETGLALPNGHTSVTSTKYFKTVTSVTPSATIGGDTVSIGWSAASVSSWGEPLNRSGSLPFNVGFCCTVASGSPTYTVQHTYDVVSVFDHASVAAKNNVAAEGTYTSPISRTRLKFTVAGGVTMTTIASHA